MIRALLVSLMMVVPAFAEDEWTPLFDGKTLEGWMSAKEGPPGKGWEVADGTIHRAGGGGDLLSKEEFGDFELEIEWKVAPGVNSGLKYRVRKSPVGWLGPEHQVLDDAKHPNGKVPKTSSASLYALFAPAEDKPLKPAGEWNLTRVVAKGNTLEHWLNGEKVLTVTVGSPEWEAAKKASKFARVEDFGAPGPGRILLQDHGGEVWFRAIRIREL